MGKMNHASEEKRLSSNEDRFISFLMKSGYLSDPKIKDPQLRVKKQERNKQTYHNTKLLLEHYRDLVWVMESIPEDLQQELDVPMGELDSLITRLDLEMSLENHRVESRLQTIMKSRMLLDRMNEAISFLRTKPKVGERLYQIIYATYIGEPRDSVLDVINEVGLSKGAYYELRKKAITLIGMRLWSAPDANFELWLELLSVFVD